ncbi:MAG: LUD domain-containing protein [Chloroflexota bacterium]
MPAHRTIAASPDAAADSALSERLARFRGKAEPLGVRVAHVAGGGEAASVVAALASEWGATGAVATSQALASLPGLFTALAGEGVGTEQASSPEHCRDRALGIGLGLLALAETGSVLVAEESLADRSVGMLTAALVLLVPAGVLADGLEDAAPALREIAGRGGGRFATLITGPSRTADIERVLTVGVQGPGKVAVVFIDEAGGA